jgi:hypothetical protein
MSALRKATEAQACALNTTMECLLMAYGYALRADCPMLAAKIRSAIKSAGGAERHMARRLRAS